jgi:short-chain fatty acids transporter
MLERLGLAFESWVRKNMPDPFTLVLLLTLLTFGLSALYAGPHGLTEAWLGGFWKLLSFAMQMVLIGVTGEALVSTRPLKRLYAWISDLPRSPSSALWILSTFALATGWLHWGFGLIGSALLAREMARTLERKEIEVDYPLMGTAAYLSMLLWHAGTTASAPLLLNTPKHFLEDKIGLVPLSQTIFLPSNLVACAALLVIVPWVVVKMHPAGAKRRAAAYLREQGGPPPAEAAEGHSGPRTPAE